MKFFKYVALLLISSSAFAASPLDRPFPEQERGPELKTKISSAQSGSVIELETGIYTGSFTISQKSNITIRAKKDAHVILTLRDPRFTIPNELWIPLENNIYRIGEILGSSIYRIDGRKVLYAKNRTHFDTLVADKIDTAFRGVGETLIYLNNDDPRITPIWISKTNGAVIACDRSPKLKIEGLEIRFGGAVGINFASGCDDSIVEGVTIFGARDGIRAKDGLSSRITVKRSWIVNDLRPSWYYRDVKGNATIEGGAIVLPGKGQIVEENVIQGWFNGIVTFCFVASCQSEDVEIRDNLIDDILDDAIELDGVTVRGNISGNRITNAFVGFSFDPRQVREDGEITVVHHNSVQVTRTPKFDRPTATNPNGTIGRPSGTKIQPVIINGAAIPPKDLLFEHNTFIGDAEIAKGAPQGTPNAYPIRIRWIRNIMISRVGPIVRHTGSPIDGNLFEDNAYFLTDPGTFAENWGVAFNGTRTSYKSLAAAKSSAPGIEAGWEKEGIEGDPLLSIPGEPSSLLPGSLAIGRGAFETESEFRVNEVINLPTGWILVKGEGFKSNSKNIHLADPIVISRNVATGRVIDNPPTQSTILTIEKVHEN